MSIFDIIFGRPLASNEARAEKIGAVAGIPIFGLDALSSAAYGPEAALTLLIPLGAAGIAYIVPISVSIIILLTIVYFSYRQTIAAYPGGGGSYTVARHNLGAFPGLLAASALMIDYLLTVAVGISAGVGALISAVPSLQPWTLPICIGVLFCITIVNLRGVREAGVFFMAPTYLFVGSLLIMIAIGVAKSIAAGGHPHPVIAHPAMPMATTAFSAWIMIKVFDSGCTAMTGVEAVSNGVKAFREPTVENAQRTLTIIIALLIVLLGGIAYLAKAYGIGATDPGQAGYQSILSMMLAAVTGRGLFYYISIGSILLVLSLSANTSFADFPRLCRIIAQDGYLPHSFGTAGRRLVYTNGIWVLAILSAGLLLLFGGVTDRLIPLYAVGAFLAFTLSQAGMVVHWRKQEGGVRWGPMMVNGLGALATGLTVIVVLVAKFIEGAWVTILLIPLMLGVMLWVRRHYQRAGAEVATQASLELTALHPPIIVLPVQEWNKISQNALRFCYSLSQEIHAVHVTFEDDESGSRFPEEWARVAEAPARAAGLQAPNLAIVESPFRWVLKPIVEFALEKERNNPDRQIAVVIPELMEKHWYHYVLHNQRAEVLKTLLMLHGNQRIVVVNVPWYLKE
jgi:amino acid transporter